MSDTITLPPMRSTRAAARATSGYNGHRRPPPVRPSWDGSALRLPNTAKPLIVSMINRWSAAGAEGWPDLRRRQKPAAAGAWRGVEPRPRSTGHGTAGLSEEHENGSLEADERRPRERVTLRKIPASWPTERGGGGGSLARRSRGSQPQGPRLRPAGGGRFTAVTAPASSPPADPRAVSFLPKLYYFTYIRPTQHIADIAAASYVDPKGTKRIILDVEGAASWYRPPWYPPPWFRPPAPAQSGSSPSCGRLGPASSVTLGRSTLGQSTLGPSTLGGAHAGFRRRRRPGHHQHPVHDL
jgi:hypothetical protein